LPTTSVRDIVILMSRAEPPLSSTLRTGVLAAVATPVDDLGRPDPHAFARVVDFVCERGVDGIVIGGATGEYASFGLNQRRLLIELGARHAAAFTVVAGIGAQSLAQTLVLAEVAADVGCRAVLLAMPHFFRYAQEDLLEYGRAVCESVEMPCLLYHLPSFTNALDFDNLVQVAGSGDGFAGMKDSSGVVSHLAPLAQAANGRSFDLFAGDDSVALAAMKAGWNGVISGIACFVPELLVSLVREFRAGHAEGAERLQADLDRVIEEVVKLPIPWAVRLGLECRGVVPGPLPLPLSAPRREQVEAFQRWFSDWLPRREWAQPFERATV
jgi:4-hydroxy-tetrahydrodipicolinate synthase